MKLISRLIAGMALLAIGNVAHSATITWTNTSGGNWSVASQLVKSGPTRCHEL